MFIKKKKETTEEGRIMTGRYLLKEGELKVDYMDPGWKLPGDEEAIEQFSRSLSNGAGQPFTLPYVLGELEYRERARLTFTTDRGNFAVSEFTYDPSDHNIIHVDVRESDTTDVFIMEKHRAPASGRTEPGTSTGNAEMRSCAHEVNNVLNLMLRMLEDPDADRLRADLRSSVKAIGRILDRQIYGDEHNDLMTFDEFREQILTVTRHLFSGVAGDHREEIVSETGWERFSCDRIVVMQVVINLITNAIKYTGEDRRIRLRIALTDGDMNLGALRIEAEDNGIGIKPENLERIFTDEFREKRADAEGKGIGLSAVRAMVEERGGSISVRSVPEQGSLFTAVIPVVFTADVTEDEPEQKEDAGRFRGLQVIAADDDEANLDYMCALLRKLSADPVEIYDWDEVLEQYENDEEDAYSVIFADLNMPNVIAAEDAISAVRGSGREDADIPIVITSGVRVPENILALGNIYEMRKPYTEEDILALGPRLKLRSGDRQPDSTGELKTPEKGGSHE